MTKLTKKQQEQQELGAYIQSIYESGYRSLPTALWVSFLKGAAGALGAIVGGTLLLTILVWILAHLGQVPLVGPITKTVIQTLNQSR